MLPIIVFHMNFLIHHWMFILQQRNLLLLISPFKLFPHLLEINVLSLIEHVSFFFLQIIPILLRFILWHFITCYWLRCPSLLISRWFSLIHRNPEHLADFLHPPSTATTVITFGQPTTPTETDLIFPPLGSSKLFTFLFQLGDTRVYTLELGTNSLKHWFQTTYSDHFFLFF